MVVFFSSFPPLSGGAGRIYIMPFLLTLIMYFRISLFSVFAAVKTHEIYNFGEWLEIADVQNHSKPHTFRIKLNEETGKAEMKYKKWTTDKVSQMICQNEQICRLS